jgi:hypothetical protein
MAVTINAKGTSVPYFKIGKQGTTLYQGDSDPSNTYTINTNDIWFDTSNGTVKFRVSNAWSGITTASDLTVTGDLTVQGTTTTVNSTEIQVQNTLKFEGSTSNDFETTLTVADPTADRTVTIQNATDTLVGRATTDTLTNKTLTSPVLGGTISVSGNLIPSVNTTYDLGSSTLRFNDIYLSGNTIDLGGTTLSKDSNGDISLKDASDNLKRIEAINIKDDITLENVGLGNSSLSSVTTAVRCTALGRYALWQLTEGSWNTGVGAGALYSTTIGHSNTGIGIGALDQNVSGNQNTALGVDAGDTITGSGNVLIGHNAGKGQTAISNKLYIDNSDTSTPLIYGDFATNEVTINGDVNVSSTGAITIPVGTTAQRPGTAVVGMLRFNSDVDYFEGFNGASWVKLGHLLATGDSHDFGAITETSDVASINYGAITDTDTDSYTYDRGLITDSDLIA